MEFNEIYNLTNNHGKKFLKTWFQKKRLLGVERRESDIVRKEFTLIYQELKGDVHTAVLPCADSNEDGCCFFGDFEYWNILYSLGKHNIQPKWNPNGYVMWPVWYTSQEEFLKFLET